MWTWTWTDESYEMEALKKTNGLASLHEMTRYHGGVHVHFISGVGTEPGRIPLPLWKWFILLRQAMTMLRKQQLRKHVLPQLRPSLCPPQSSANPEPSTEWLPRAAGHGCYQGTEPWCMVHLSAALCSVGDAGTEIPVLSGCQAPSLRVQPSLFPHIANASVINLRVWSQPIRDIPRGHLYLGDKWCSCLQQFGGIHRGRTAVQW